MGHCRSQVFGLEFSTCNPQPQAQCSPGHHRELPRVPGGLLSKNAGLGCEEIQSSRGVIAQVQRNTKDTIEACAGQLAPERGPPGVPRRIQELRLAALERFSAGTIAQALFVPVQQDRLNILPAIVGGRFRW